MRETPTIGIHKNIQAEAYHNWDALSHHWLEELRRSPAHLRSHLTEPQVATLAMRIGRAAHAAILEPEDFVKRFRRGPEGDRRTTKVKEAGAAAVAEVGEDAVLSPDDYGRCLAMRDAVWATKMGKALLG